MELCKDDFIFIMPKKGSKLPECERGCLNKDGKLKHHGPARCEKRKVEAIKAKEFTSIYFFGVYN